MSRTKFLSCFGLALLFVVSLAGQSAWADTISFDIDTGNSAVSGFSGPYVTVTVNRTSTTQATITFASLTSNSGNSNCTVSNPCTYRMGDGSTAAVNVNASSFTLTGISGNGATTYSVANPPGTSNVNGFGSFNAVIDSADGFPDSSTSVSFVLTNLSGTWTTASDVLTANSNGALGGSHIFVQSGLCTDGRGTPVACTTGFGAGSDAESPPPVDTPEPGSILLLGTGLVGLAAWARRRGRA